MKKGSVSVELRPDRSLLDPSFEGYKLSLDSIPIYRKTIETGVRVVQPNDDQYSFYHVKLFSLHNHLYVNPFKPTSVYFVDGNSKVFKVILSPSNQISLREVYQLSKSQTAQNVRYNTSIVFASSDVVVVSDGEGTLHLAKTNGEDENETWEICNLNCVFREEVSCVLSDARVVTVDGKRVLHVMLIHVEEKTDEEKDSESSGSFHTVLKWRTFIQNQENSWDKGFLKKLSIDGSVDYVALEPSCKSINIISDKLPKWIYDSEKPVETDTEMDITPEPEVYTWSQTEEDVTLWLPFPDGSGKADFEIKADDKQLEVKVKGETIIYGEFFSKVDKDLTSWNFDKNQLEIQLSKSEKSLWWRHCVGDGKGREIIQPIRGNITDFQEENIHPSFNSQQLEECDVVSCDTTSLARINCEDHSVTHEVSLSSSQWLFKVHCDPEQTPAVCIRHDVDACVWQFKEVKEDDQTWPYQHIGTFSAFGYVQASKTQKKFLASPSNLSYVTVCEGSHHIYVYRQPSVLETELKNRTTGKKVKMISKQQLVNLETNEQILGVHATDTVLYALLEKTICVLVINEQGI